MKTILEIAKSADVSKMKVRRYIEKWDIVPEQTGTVLRFSDTDSNKIIKALSGNGVERVSEQTGTESEHVPIQNFIENEQNDTLDVVVEMLKKELESKENQLIKKDKQIDDLNDRLAHEQQLNEHTQILFKKEQDKNILLLESPSGKKSFFGRLFSK